MYVAMLESGGRGSHTLAIVLQPFGNFSLLSLCYDNHCLDCYDLSSPSISWDRSLSPEEFKCSTVQRHQNVHILISHTLQL